MEELEKRHRAYSWGRVLDYIGVEWRQEMLDGF